jgi:membrane protease YdiL (CAAX protease family)
MDIEKKRLKLFLILAFGISWITGGVIALTGGIVNSPVLVPGTNVTFALVLEASVYMWGPALANIITRAITKESWQNALLKPKLKSGWRYWLMAWFGPGILTLLGAALFFVILPQYFDSNFTTLRAQMTAANPSADVSNPMRIVISQIVLALFLSPVLNGIATFGEEFGWRAYLLPKLSSLLNKRKALLLSSAIWGLWHWPVIAMGHNYGLNYWGYPWLGLLATVWIMMSIGVFFGWMTQKAGSVWPGVIAHGALNGIAAIGLLFVSGSFPTLLGPTSAGILGCLPFTLVSLVILLKMKD